MEMKEILYNKVQVGLEGDDIILEIKILNTNLEDWNQLVRTIKNIYMIECYGAKKIIPEKIIDESYFPLPPDYEFSGFKIRFEHFKLSIEFYEIDIIEIFTDSVVNLSQVELSPLFEFVEYLGSNIKKEVGVYIESTKNPIFKYESNKWIIN